MTRKIFLYPSLASQSNQKRRQQLRFAHILFVVVVVAHLVPLKYLSCALITKSRAGKEECVLLSLVGEAYSSVSAGPHPLLLCSLRFPVYLSRRLLRSRKNERRPWPFSSCYFRHLLSPSYHVHPNRTLSSLAVPPGLCSMLVVALCHRSLFPFKRVRRRRLLRVHLRSTGRQPQRSRCTRRCLQPQPLLLARILRLHRPFGPVCRRRRCDRRNDWGLQYSRFRRWVLQHGEQQRNLR